MNNDDNLKLALAKMLPEKIQAKEEWVVVGWVAQDETEREKQWVFRWVTPKETRGTQYWPAVLNTEWLHVCWLVEQTFDKDKEVVGRYISILQQQDYEWFYGFSWQQRATALAKLKGIEV